MPYVRVSGIRGRWWRRWQRQRCSHESNIITNVGQKPKQRLVNGKKSWYKANFFISLEFPIQKTITSEYFYSPLFPKFLKNHSKICHIGGKIWAEFPPFKPPFSKILDPPLKLYKDLDIKIHCFLRPAHLLSHRRACPRVCPDARPSARDGHREGRWRPLWAVWATGADPAVWWRGTVLQSTWPTGHWDDGAAQRARLHQDQVVSLDTIRVGKPCQNGPYWILLHQSID